MKRKRFGGRGEDEGGDQRVVIMTRKGFVQEKTRLRPRMPLVVDMLEGRVRVDMPPDTRIVVVDFLCVDEESATDSNSMPRLDFVSNQRTQSNVESSSTYSFATTIMSGR